MKKFAIMLAFGAAACLTGNAAAADPTAADSAAMAIATVWGQYLRPALEPYTGQAGAIDSYMSGVSESLLQRGQTDPRTRGLVEGVQLKQRLAEIESMGIAINNDAFVAALTKALKGEDTGFTPETADAFMNSQLRLAQQGAAPAVDAEYAASQVAFLDAQRNREGVTVTPDGLIFEVITEGEGAQPGRADKVRLNYTGRLSDGTEFDGTNGNPVTFGVSNLIPGFTEGLTMMKPGGTYRIFIPADLGYGERGAGGVIPPGAALDFTVELLEVVPQ